MNASTPIEVVAEFLSVFREHDDRAALPVLGDLPVLVVGAVGDLLTPVEHSRELAQQLSGAAYVEVADAGHMVMLERHDVVTAHLAELLDRVEAGLPKRRKSRRWWRQQ